jgi:hypothetical protein
VIAYRFQLTGTSLELTILVNYVGYAPGAEFEAQIPAEHEGGDQGVKGVEQPDWA